MAKNFDDMARNAYNWINRHATELLENIENVVAGAVGAHASSHQNGGTDEISVAGLSGDLADAQDPKNHASNHTNGTDDIQNATAAQKGLATAAQITKLDGIEALADVTDATNVQAAITTQTYIDLPEAAEPATPAANTLRLFVTDEQGYSILSFKNGGGMVRQIVRDSVFIGYNNTGSTIAAARIVYASGSTGTVPTIALAKADSAATMPAIGITIDSVADGAYARIMQVGLLEDVNTSAYSAGDVLYVSAATAGIPTGTAPVYPNISQEIGTILVDDVAVGSIQIVARGMLNFAVQSHATSHESGGADQIHSIADDDDDTKIQVEEAADEDTIRMDVAGTEAFVLGATGILTLSQQAAMKATYSVQQVIPDNAWVGHIFDTEAYDTQNEFDSTVTSGTADATEAFKLHDADAGFAAADVGAFVWNTTDNTYAIVTAFVDSGELTLDTDIMVNGETYVVGRARYTATEDGTYLMIHTVIIPTIVVNSLIALEISVNGASIGSFNATNAQADWFTAMFIATAQMSAGDYAQGKVKQISGAARNLGTAASQLLITKLF